MESRKIISIVSCTRNRKENTKLKEKERRRKERSDQCFLCNLLAREHPSSYTTLLPIYILF